MLNIQKSLFLYFKIGLLILIGFNLSCVHKSDPKVVHMDFCDGSDFVFTPGDTLHLHPLKTAWMCYYINSNESDLEPDFFNKYISQDPVIQRQIENRYPQLSITFYKESKDIEMLLARKSRKYLSYCNRDIVVEYTWHYGKAGDDLYYKDGMIVLADTSPK